MMVSGKFHFQPFILICLPEIIMLITFNFIINVLLIYEDDGEQKYSVDVDDI